MITSSPGVSTLFPGHQKTSTSTPYEEALEKKLETELSPVPAVSESEWETDYTEDEEVKPKTVDSDDPLAKLDNLDLDSDDDMRYRRQSKVAAQKTDPPPPSLPEAAEVTILEPPTTNGVHHVTNGFHKEEEVRHQNNQHHHLFKKLYSVKVVHLCYITPRAHSAYSKP